MMLPTARDALGRPAAAATSPYVDTRPAGMRRTTEITREENSALFIPQSSSLGQKINQKITRSPPPACSPPVSIFTAWPPLGVTFFVPCE